MQSSLQGRLPQIARFGILLSLYGMACFYPARNASAQAPPVIGPGPPPVIGPGSPPVLGSPGYWAFTLQGNGAGDGTDTYQGYPPIKLHQAWNSVPTQPNQKAAFWSSFFGDSGIGGGHIVDITNTGTVHLKCVWIPSPNTPSPAPPQLSILFSPGAYWSVGSNSTNPNTLYAHSADDGFNDPEITVGDPITSGSTGGKHLKVYQSGSGVVEDDIPINSHIVFLTPVAGGSCLMMSSLTATEDTRRITLSSDHDATNVSVKYLPPSGLVPFSG